MRRTVSVTAVLAALLAVATAVDGATYPVTTTDDTADGMCDGHCSLREAITAANQTPGADVIVLSAGVYTLRRGGALEDANEGGDLDVTDDLVIAGAGARLTVLDGGHLDRVLHVVNASLELRDLTVGNGAAPGQPGGGIAVFGGSLTLERVAVSANRGASGGGVYAGASDLSVSDSTIADNVGDSGGGLYFQGFTRRLDVRNSTISDNVAGVAGGLFVDLECGFAAPCAVRSTTIAGNRGDTGVGGVQCIAPLGSLTFTGTVLADNAGGNCAPGTAVSLGHNLADDTSCPFGAGGDVANVSAGLLPLRANGGPTDTRALTIGSAALDGGDAATCPTLDQRGQPRVGPCDIGAFEAGPGPCGDAITNLGEQCDDGNAAADDCCSPACTAANDGTACADDGDPCTSDACNAGARCVHLAAPATGCHSAERSFLTLHAEGGALWKWLHGDATLPSELGDPITSTGSRYAFCVYGDDPAAVLVSGSVAPGADWRSISNGFRYRSATGDKLLVRAGAAGRSKAQLKLGALALPPLPLGLASDLIVQLRNDHPGACWESRFSATDIVRDDASALTAKHRR